MGDVDHMTSGRSCDNMTSGDHVIGDVDTT